MGAVAACLAAMGEEPWPAEVSSRCPVSAALVLRQRSTTSQHHIAAPQHSTTAQHNSTAQQRSITQLPGMDARLVPAGGGPPRQTGRMPCLSESRSRVCRKARRNCAGQTPRTPALAGRLVEIVRDDGEPRSPRRPDCSLRCPGSLPSSCHSAASQCSIAVQHHSAASQRSTPQLHGMDAMRSISGRRPAKTKRQDVVFVVNTDTCVRWAARRNRKG